MLAKLRKFSSSIFAKFFLAIVAIPFIFWGMGPLFTGGSQNTIVTIGKEKFSTDEFTNFIRYKTTNSSSVDENLIENLFSTFIGEKIMELEINYFNFKLSDNSLSSIIKNKKAFLKGNKFSRTAYEKFLLESNTNAASFEYNLSKQEKKNQLLNFIGGGIVPSHFVVNLAYDKINQQRDIEFINLNDIFKNKFNFSENNIQSYYNQNKETFIDIYKTINFAKLDPRILSGANEFNDLFFRKIDEIDDLIVEGKSLKYISKKYNLESSTSFTIDSQGIDIKSKNKINFPDKLISKIIIIDNEDPILLIENIEEYFIFELSKTEKVQKKINDKSVAKEILANLERQTKRKIISEIVAKINNNNFNKKQFNELSKDENAVIKKITLASKNDDKILKQELVKQIYAFSENRVIVVTDIDLSENFLIYIDKINNESIDRKSEDYNKYFNLSKTKMVSNLYKTYDTYLKNKYEININHKALDAVKNYFK